MKNLVASPRVEVWTEQGRWEPTSRARAARYLHWLRDAGVPGVVRLGPGYTSEGVWHPWRLWSRGVYPYTAPQPPSPGVTLWEWTGRCYLRRRMVWDHRRVGVAR